MKLDTPLDIKGPYNVRGTVDVYFSNGRWLARSWPKRPKQPNSSSQVNSRAIFSKMLEDRKALPAQEIDLWKNSVYPPDKTWDDVWRSSRLKFYHKYDISTIPPRSQTAKVYYAIFNLWGDVWPWHRWHVVGSFEDEGGYSTRWLQNIWHWNGTKQLFTWTVNGMLCYAGKKIIPHYVPSYPQTDPGTIWGLGRSIFGRPFSGIALGSDSDQPISTAGFVDYKPEKFDMNSYILYLPFRSWKSPDYTVTMYA